MQITNPDHDIVISYQPIGDEVLRTSTFHDGRTGRKTFSKDEADEDAIDLVDNYEYEFI